MISIQRWAIAASVIALGALCLAACGDKEEAPAQSALEKARSALPPTQQPEVVPGEDGEIRYEGQTEEGEQFKAQIGGDVTLPESFPEDLPLYPNAVPFAAMELGGGTSVVSVNCDAQAPEVYQFYREELPASGWKVESEMTVANTRLLTASKGGVKTVVQIESTGTGTRVGFELRQ